MTAQAQTLATLRSKNQFLHSKPMRFFDENGDEIKRTNLAYNKLSLGYRSKDL